MSARNTDDGRVIELWHILIETEERVSALGLTKERFVSDDSLQGRMNVDAIFMCVFRAAIWSTVVVDLPVLKSFCLDYAASHGIAF